MNFDGIEAVYCQNTTDETTYYLNIVDTNNMLSSCGSDFHGDIVNDTRHGDIGSMELSEKYLKPLLDALDIPMTI
jgi:hypothetical protein